MTVAAIQGEPGSYSHDAALRALGACVAVLACRDFRTVFDALAAERADVCVVPVENTIIGAIAEPLALIRAGRVRAAGEVQLEVNHCLVGPDDGRWRQRMRWVASHPAALAQCGRFLRAHPLLRAVRADDTAGSVRALAEGRLDADAAIASRGAAERYGCRVLSSAIQDQVPNFTRFLVLEIDTQRPTRPTTSAWARSARPGSSGQVRGFN